MAALSEVVLAATLAICSDATLLERATPAAPMAGLVVLGWRPVEADDREAYVAQITGALNAIGFHSEGATSPGSTADEVIAANFDYYHYEFPQVLKEVRAYFHGADTLLYIDVGNRECTLLTGPGPSAERLHQSIPTTRLRLPDVPLIDWRSRADAQQSGGLSEAVFIFRDNVAPILQREIGTAYLFRTVMQSD